MLPRHRTLVAVGVIGVVATQSFSLLSAAPDRATTEARKAIQSLYNRVNAAAANKDLKTVQSVRTKNYVYISTTPNKRHDPRYREYFDRRILNAKLLRMYSTIRKITLRKNTATVLVDETSLMTQVDPQTKQVLTSRGKAQSLDRWIKIKGRWFLAQSKELSRRSWHDNLYYDVPKPMET